LSSQARDDGEALHAAIRARAIRLSAIVQGVATGTLAGLGLFLATNWLVLKGGPRVGPHLALLAQFFPGYRVTFVGSLIGFAYAFVVGFAAGSLVATVYNRVLTLRESGRPTRHGA
jgi:hypothetical protein